jgi:hypothetical protein
VYAVEGKNAKLTEEAVFAKEGHNKPLAMGGIKKPVAKDEWGVTMSPLPQG